MSTTLLKKASALITTSVLLTCIASLSSVLLITNHANAAELIVSVNKINTIKGHIMLGLYDDETSYKQGNPVHSARVKVNKSQEKIIFTELPDGEYAIKLFQDENDNNKMDMNMMGIPKESYGFSNNGGRFGQPDYKEAKFSVKDNTRIEINLF
ncbi:MAG: DUF2141 domain-containing protein [Alteromonadaceae bacterium]|nr:DUF2141 domain-containing protein [Alteromonadaceae bacterium]MBL4908720.1 DUF2141 domain-containing protein [Alteromonadaceae bacterium]